MPTNAEHLGPWPLGFRSSLTHRPNQRPADNLASRLTEKASQSARGNPLGGAESRPKKSKRVLARRNTRRRICLGRLGSAPACQERRRGQGGKTGGRWPAVGQVLDGLLPSRFVLINCHGCSQATRHSRQYLHCVAAQFILIAIQKVNLDKKSAFMYTERNSYGFELIEVACFSGVHQSHSRGSWGSLRSEPVNFALPNPNGP